MTLEDLEIRNTKALVAQAIDSGVPLDTNRLQASQTLALLSIAESLSVLRGAVDEGWLNVNAGVTVFPEDDA